MKVGLPVSFENGNQQKLILIATAIIVAIVLAWLPSGWEGLADVFIHTIYYFLWAAIGLLVLAVAEDFTDQPVSFLKTLSRYKYPIALSGALTTVTFLSVGIDFRVLADETNLIASSLSLHMDRTFRNITEAHHYYESMHVITGKTPVRPALFPFSMNFLHSFFGYSVYHGFAINFAAAFGALLAVVRLGEKLADRALGIIAGVLLMSIPLYSLVITSSGFDALNLFLHTVILLQLFRFLTNPTALQFEILLLVELLGSQCRYETLMYLLPVMIAGGLHYKSVLASQISWRVIFVPFLFVPIVWQRVIHGTKYLQVMDGDTAYFSVQYLMRNAANAFEFFFDYGDKEYPSSLMLMILVIIGVFGLIFQFGKSTEEKKSEHSKTTFLFGGLVALGLFMMAVIQFSYSMGDLTTPYNMRYGVIYLVGFVFLAACPVYRLYQTKSGAVMVAIFLTLNFVVYISVAAENRFGKTLTLPREYKRNLAFLKDYPRSGTLIIADRPGLYTAHRFAAVGFNYADSNHQTILNNLQRGLYQIFVIQQIYYTHQRKRNTLNALFKTEVVYEYQNSAEYSVRISKIIL